jgi:hypothetical protein
MNKQALLLITFLSGAANAANSTNTEAQQAADTQVKAARASALSFLIKTGSVQLDENGSLKVSKDLMNELRESGIIEVSASVRAGSMCTEGSK